MPTYEYECQACRHRLEEFQSFSAKPLKKCPACGKSKLKRLIGTGAGIIFKGSGFYETDYRSANYQKEAKADSPPISPPISPSISPPASPAGSSPDSQPHSAPASSAATSSATTASSATASSSASATTCKPAT